jgi:hypothetical protein
MLMEKIRHGVLAVHTDAGVHYVRPTLKERLLLLWTFRHFTVLPETVLKGYERHVISTLLRKSDFLRGGNGRHVPTCIGTIERLTPLPPRKPPQRATTAQPATSTVATELR